MCMWRYAQRDRVVSFISFLSHYYQFIKNVIGKTRSRIKLLSLKRHEKLFLFKFEFPERYKEFLFTAFHVTEFNGDHLSKMKRKDKKYTKNGFFVLILWWRNSFTIANANNNNYNWVWQFQQNVVQMITGENCPLIIFLAQRWKEKLADN